MRTLFTIAVTTMILFAPWLRPGTTELKALVNLFHYIFLIIALLPSAVRKVMEGKMIRLGKNETKPNEIL